MLDTSAVIVLLLASALAGASAQSDIVEGELDILEPRDAATLYVLRGADGSAAPLALDAATASSLTPYAGYRIRVRRANRTATPNPSPSPTPGSRRLLRQRSRLQEQTSGALATASPDGETYVEVASVDVLGPVGGGGAKEFGAANITSVVYLLSFCGYKRALNASAFRAQWVNGESTPATAYTMQNYWATCSGGLAVLNNRTQLVVEVTVPCSGSSSSGAYNGTAQCRTQELYTWMANAESYVATTLKLDIGAIKQRIAVLPVEMQYYCGWSGLGSVGCGGSRCYTWVVGNAATDLSIFFHEMGHNLGLLHAKREGSDDDYGDYTCAMGSGCTCFSAPNAWHLGWATPLPAADLNASTLLLGTWRTFALPYSTRAAANHVRVTPDWAAPSGSSFALATALSTPVPVWYVSARAPVAPFENGLAAPGAVDVHSSSMTLAYNTYQGTTLHAVLASAGTNYSAPLPYGLRVTVAAIHPTDGAVVRLCRFNVAAESTADGTCFDGIDNDCDGLSDEMDPDCNPSTGLVTTPTPTPTPTPKPTSTPTPTPTPTPKPTPTPTATPTPTSTPKPTPMPTLTPTPKPTPTPTPSPAAWNPPDTLQVRTYEFFAPSRTADIPNTRVTAASVASILCPAARAALVKQLGAKALLKPNVVIDASTSITNCTDIYASTRNTVDGFAYRLVVAAPRLKHANLLQKALPAGVPFVVDAGLVCGSEVHVGLRQPARDALTDVAPAPFLPYATVNPYRYLVGGAACLGMCVGRLPAAA